MSETLQTNDQSNQLRCEAALVLHQSGNSAVIGGVQFEAIRFHYPRPHWRYCVGETVGSQGFKSKPKMFADLEHAYKLRPDRWANDWLKFTQSFKPLAIEPNNG